MALQIGERRDSIYLDLEEPEDRVRVSNAARYMADHERELVILDEVQRTPEIFQPLRGVIDRGRPQGRPNGRLLLLGSAAMNLLQQSGESLAVESRTWNWARSTCSKLTPPISTSYGCGEGFLAVFSLRPTIAAWSGAEISLPHIWSETSRSSDRAYRRRRFAASGLCSRTTRPRC